jgi:uncharacterized membrane protein YkgB
MKVMTLYTLLVVISVACAVLLSMLFKTPTLYVDEDTGCEYLAVGFGAVIRYDETGRNVRGCREGPGRD